MGGAGYIFLGDNDAEIMHTSVLINLHILNRAKAHQPGVIFYSSSACVYPEHNQLEPENPKTNEDSVYPAAPDSEYGWEKLFSERLYLSYQRNFGINVRIARFHNIYGPLGAWNDGREKVPAAMCRKVAEVVDGGGVEIWGDGEQTRSFLYIDECLDGVRRLMQSDISTPLNIGSDYMVSINQLTYSIAALAGKKVHLEHIDGPLGVRGRTSDNSLIHEKLGWRPEQPLHKGLEITYRWIAEQVESSAG
ncbi:MAG: GDP-D-mannose 3',5'-epimerase [Parasphingorhabdus sp.]|jgi:GDP-D-mannose 3',5'-epimerase